MTPVIQQRVRFRTSPRTLFDLYLDSRRHSLSTGAPANISHKIGGKFKAFAGQLQGKNLLIVPGKQIVQLWRATHWKKADWSILILTFSAAAGGAQVDLVHIGVPAYDHQGVRKGWPQYYWQPWKKYLHSAAK
jgi:activator of HSP90 ATPase